MWCNKVGGKNEKFNTEICIDILFIFFCIVFKVFSSYKLATHLKCYVHRLYILNEFNTEDISLKESLYSNRFPQNIEKKLSHQSVEFWGWGCKYPNTNKSFYFVLELTCFKILTDWEYIIPARKIFWYLNHLEIIRL